MRQFHRRLGLRMRNRFCADAHRVFHRGKTRRHCRFRLLRCRGARILRSDRSRREQRNNGLGSALLLAALHDMSAQGYAYAIIGRVPDAEFYRRNLNVIEIPDSEPGFYRGLLKST